MGTLTNVMTNLGGWFPSRIDVMVEPAPLRPMQDSVVGWKRNRLLQEKKHAKC